MSDIPGYKTKYVGGSVNRTYIFDNHGNLVKDIEGDQRYNPAAVFHELPSDVKTTIAKKHLGDLLKDTAVNLASQIPFLGPSPKGAVGLIARMLGSGGTGFVADRMVNPDKSMQESAGEAALNSLIGGTMLGKQTMKLNVQAKEGLGSTLSGRMRAWILPEKFSLEPKMQTIKEPLRVPMGQEYVQEPQLAPGMRWAKEPDKVVTDTIRPRVPKNYQVIVPGGEPPVDIPGLPPGAQVKFVGDIPEPKLYKGGQRMPEIKIDKVVPGASKKPPAKIYTGGQIYGYQDKQIPIKVSNLRKALAGVGANEVIDLGPLINDLFGPSKD